MTLSPNPSALRAQLVQRSSALAVPTGARVELVSGAVRVELPRVSRPGDFELRIASHSAEQLGSVALRVYPDDLLVPLREWAGRRSLRVIEDDGRLAGLLERLEVPFRAKGAAPVPNAKPPVTLYAGRRTLARHRDRLEPHAVVFAEHEQGLPHVVVSDTAQGRIVRVEIELLARLESDPRAQQTFLALFELFEEPSS